MKKKIQQLDDLPDPERQVQDGNYDYERYNGIDYDQIKSMYNQFKEAKGRYCEVNVGKNVYRGIISAVDTRTMMLYITTKRGDIRLRVGIKLSKINSYAIQL